MRSIAKVKFVRPPPLPCLWFDGNAEAAANFTSPSFPKPGAMEALLKMKKLDIAELKRAAA